MKKTILVLILIIASFSYAQTTEVNKLEIKNVPISNSTDSISTIDVSGLVRKADLKLEDIATKLWVNNTSKWLNSSTSGRIYNTGRVAVGNDNATGTEYLSVGNAKNGSTADAKVLINHNLTDASGSGNSHGFNDNTQITRTGNIGYNSFQADVSIAVDFHHYNAFQTDVEVNTATSGIVRGARHSAYGSGSAAEFRGVEVYDPSLTIDKAYGLYINKIDNGTSYNRAIKTWGGVVEFANNYTTGDIEVLRLSRNQVSAGNKQAIKFFVGSSEIVAGEIISQWQGKGDGDLVFNTTLNNSSSEGMRLTDVKDLEIVGNVKASEELIITPVSGYSEINTGSGLILKSNSTGEIITLGDTESFTFNALSSTFFSDIINVNTLLESTEIKASSVDFSGLPQHDTDSLAGVNGVQSGYLYKTSTGEIRIKL